MITVIFTHLQNGLAAFVHALRIIRTQPSLLLYMTLSSTYYLIANTPFPAFPCAYLFSYFHPFVVLTCAIGLVIDIHYIVQGGHLSFREVLKKAGYKADMIFLWGCIGLMCLIVQPFAQPFLLKLYTTLPSAIVTSTAWLVIKNIFSALIVVSWLMFLVTLIIITAYERQSLWYSTQYALAFAKAQWFKLLGIQIAILPLVVGAMLSTYPLLPLTSTSILLAGTALLGSILWHTIFIVAATLLYRAYQQDLLEEFMFDARITFMHHDF